LKDSQHTFSCR